MRWAKDQRHNPTIARQREQSKSSELETKAIIVFSTLVCSAEKNYHETTHPLETFSPLASSVWHQCETTFPLEAFSPLGAEV